MRIKIGFILTLLLALPALADRRSFIRSYEFQTQPQGNLEFEMWNEVESPRGAIADSLITHKLELEYGLTDRWDTALYHVFVQGGPQVDPEPFHFDSWRLETRYRLAEKNEWPVDVMVYGEIERPADFNQPFEVEEKLILEKDFVPTRLSTGRTLPTADIVGRRKSDGCHIVAQCKKDATPQPVDPDFLSVSESLALNDAAYYFAYGGWVGEVPKNLQVIDRAFALRWAEFLFTTER